MTEGMILDIVREGVITILVVSAPPLIMGLVVGVIVSIFQTVTSIQEPTLAFVPKIVAVFLAIVIFGPWMLTRLDEFFQLVLSNLPYILGTE